MDLSESLGDLMGVFVSDLGLGRREGLLGHFVDFSIFLLYGLLELIDFEVEVIDLSKLLLLIEQELFFFGLKLVQLSFEELDLLDKSVKLYLRTWVLSINLNKFAR